jgi:DnaJ-class molecular chaperone
MPKGKQYSYDAYLNAFRPEMCRTCDGSGVTGRLALGTLRVCAGCDGTGRKDGRTPKQIVDEAMRKVRAASPAYPSPRGKR